MGKLNYFTDLPGARGFRSDHLGAVDAAQGCRGADGARLRPHRLGLRRRHITLLMLGSPIRKSPDQSLLTATRSLSQSSTSFIGNIRLGIHYVPLSTFLCIDLTSSRYFAITVTVN